MPFEPGNTHGAKTRRVERMLERAVAQDDGARLRKGVERLLDLFAEGDRWAVEFVTEQLDGKKPQQLNVAVEHSVGAFLELIVPQTLHLVGQNEQNAQIAEVIEETTH